jgi:alpha-N-acetylglucosaminidase
MSNLEGYGGPVPEELINRRLELGQRIVARMRELGMEPVLQGYYGMVPADFGRRFSNIKIHAQGTWGDLKRPDMLDPTDPMFEKVASAFYREQTRVLGPAHFYAADPFHEGGSTNEIDVAAAGLAIQKAMRGATWVLQSWQDNPRQPMLDALDKDKVLVLDLWCEAQENWRKRNNFNGTPWLWCAINDFGGNVGMGGALEWISQGPAKAFADPARGRMSGIGALMEGTGGNPVLWELFFENASHGGMTNLDSWLKDYCLRRYGAAIPSAEKAWKILAASVYGPSSSKIEYPINSSVCARPTLKPEARARAFVTTQPNYDPARLAEAWGLLLKAAPQAARSEGYRHDLADTGREVLAGLGTRYHQQMVAAYQAKDAATLRTLSDRMLGLIRDMDELVGTRREFLLGVWLEDARRWGVTSDEKDLCERNARELLTLWTSTYNITDYANRQWNGLLGDFYYHRWELWLKALNDSVATGVPIDEGAVRQRIAEWELGWTRQHNRFPSEPRGDVVAISQRSFDKYSAEVMRSSLSESNRAQLDAAK